MSLKPEYFCNTCNKTQGIDNSTLKLCTRCKFVHYCDQKCQKQDFPTHKKYCKVISEGRIRIENTIENDQNIPGLERENEFRNVMIAHECFEIGRAYFHEAEHLNSYVVYQRALEMFELVNIFDNGSNLFTFMYLFFIWLNLGRYDMVEQYLIKSENQNTWEKQTGILSDDFKGPLKFGSAYFLARFAYYLQRLSKYFKKVQN